MVPSARTRAFLAGFTAVAVTGVLSVQSPAIGYIYAGSISTGHNLRIGQR